MQIQSRAQRHRSSASTCSCPFMEPIQYAVLPFVPSWSATEPLNFEKRKVSYSNARQRYGVNRPRRTRRTFLKSQIIQCIRFQAPRSRRGGHRFDPQYGQQQHSVRGFLAGAGPRPPVATYPIPILVNIAHSEINSLGRGPRVRSGC